MAKPPSASRQPIQPVEAQRAESEGQKRWRDTLVALNAGFASSILDELSMSECFEEKTKIYSQNIAQVVKWMVGDEPVWLVQTHCEAMNSGNALDAAVAQRIRRTRSAHTARATFQSHHENVKCLDLTPFRRCIP